MRFEKRLPNDTATLLLLSVFLIVAPRASPTRSATRRASTRSRSRSSGRSACSSSTAPGSSATSAPTARRSEAAGGADARRAALHLGARAARGRGVSAALVSDWFVDAIDPAVEKLGISKAFTGLVIVAIAGNAVENVVAVQLARKGQSDLALSVVKNSVAQIACFLFPALVLISLLFTEQLTFVIDPVYVGALALTAIAVWQITGDGEAVLFEGLALVALYVVLATLVWFE